MYLLQLVKLLKLQCIHRMKSSFSPLQNFFFYIFRMYWNVYYRKANKKCYRLSHLQHFVLFIFLYVFLDSKNLHFLFVNVFLYFKNYLITFSYLPRIFCYCFSYYCHLLIDFSYCFAFDCINLILKSSEVLLFYIYCYSLLCSLVLLWSHL